MDDHAVFGAHRSCVPPLCDRTHRHPFLYTNYHHTHHHHTHYYHTHSRRSSIVNCHRIVAKAPVLGGSVAVPPWRRLRCQHRRAHCSHRTRRHCTGRRDMQCLGCSTFSLLTGSSGSCTPSACGTTQRPPCTSLSLTCSAQRATDGRTLPPAAMAFTLISALSTQVNMPHAALPSVHRRTSI